MHRLKILELVDVFALAESGRIYASHGKAYLNLPFKFDGEEFNSMHAGIHRVANRGLGGEGDSFSSRLRSLVMANKNGQLWVALSTTDWDDRHVEVTGKVLTPPEGSVYVSGYVVTDNMAGKNGMVGFDGVRIIALDNHGKSSIHYLPRLGADSAVASNPMEDFIRSVDAKRMFITEYSNDYDDEYEPIISLVSTLDSKGHVEQKCFNNIGGGEFLCNPDMLFRGTDVDDVVDLHSNNQGSDLKRYGRSLLAIHSDGHLTATGLCVDSGSDCDGLNTKTIEAVNLKEILPTGKGFAIHTEDNSLILLHKQSMKGESFKRMQVDSILNEALQDASK